MSKISVYLERDNTTTLALYQDGSKVAEDTALTAHFSFGDYCIKSTEATDPIEVVNYESGRAIEMQLGLITDLTPETYTGYLTIYDAINTNGLAWSKHVIEVIEWPVCA